MNIGFIGLGNMGAPMARNLAAAGHAVTGFDPAGVSVEGVLPVASATEAAAGREVVVTMLPNGAILRAVYAEIVPAAGAGTVLVDCSTVDVDSARAVAAEAAAAGLAAIDAPVSGGTVGAAAGTLTFMAGGPADAFEAIRPLLEVMGSRAVLCGPAGAGQAAKICNNMILGISMLGVCEAFALAGKLGLDAQALYDVVSTSSGACWSVTTYCPVPGVGPKSPVRQRLSPRLRRRADAEGPPPRPGCRRLRRRGHAARRPCRRALRGLRRRRGPRPRLLGRAPLARRPPPRRRLTAPQSAKSCTR